MTGSGLKHRSYGLPGLLIEGSGGEPALRGWRRVLFDPYLVGAFRLLIAAVFIYASLEKIGKPLLFADEIEMYGIISEGTLLYIIAIVLPWLELLCGIAMLTGVFMRGAALILVAMNSVFLIVIAYRTAGIMSSEGISLSKVYFDCGCGFGPTFAWKKLIEDATLLAGSLVVFLSPSYRFTVTGRKEV